MLVLFAGDAVTSIMASVTAFPLNFKQYTNVMEAVQLQLKKIYIYIYIYIALLQLIKVY